MGQDAKLWVVKGKKKGTYYPQSLLLWPHELLFPSEDGEAEKKKKDCSLTFNNASPVTGSATVKAAVRSFHTSCLAFMRSVKPRRSTDDFLRTGHTGLTLSSCLLESRLYGIAAALAVRRQAAEGPLKWIIHRCTAHSLPSS